MRYNGLDGLRAVAALFVICEHWIAPDNPVKRFIPSAGLGIEIFFVLSGFLITDILLKQRDKISRGQITIAEGIAQFYIARIFRILPLYVFGIALLWSLNVGDTRNQLLWWATFSENLYPSFNNAFMGLLGHYWTLAIEWKFYIVWGVLIIVARQQFIPFILIMPVLLAPLWRLYSPELIGLPYTSLWVPGAMDSLGIGGALAYLLRAHGRSPALHSAVLVALGIGGTMLVESWAARAFVLSMPVYFGILEYTGTALFAVSLVYIMVANEKEIFLLDSPVMRYLRRISFGIYVYHLVLLGALPEIAKLFDLHLTLFPYYNTWWFRSSTTLTVSAASWAFLEKPIISLGKSISIRALNQMRKFYTSKQS
jgi:peptidoglycan/LPS O-acetylase OafA/YrhL